MGVALLTGDFMLGATGTVTRVDGDRIYGFGHPMYNLGPTQFPLTDADVHVILPSLMTSSKMASFGDVVGTVQQDRATAVAGRLGKGPAMIPMQHHAQLGSHAEPHVHLLDGPGPHVHAAAHLPLRSRTC